jgi:cytoskeletal protein RodZ
MNKRVKPIHNSRIQLNKRMETVGDTFVKERKKLKKNLSSVSLDTRIDVKKLKALEENNFSVFESPVSTKGFIKIYSEYLGLDPEKILAIHRRDFGEKKEEVKIIAKENKSKFSLTYLYLLIPIIILGSTLIYFYNQFSHFQSPPELEIFEPKNNTILTEERLEVQGQTERDTIIEIEGEKVPVDENGFFITKVSMEPGNNIIAVRATNSRNPNRENIKIINVEYKVPEPIVENEEEEKEVTEINLTVTVENAPTWVEIILDDQLIVSQVLETGYKKTFKGERNVLVNTGILQNTKVEINGDRKALSHEEFTIKCELNEGKLACE